VCVCACACIRFLTMFAARLASKSSTLARVAAQRLTRSQLPVCTTPRLNFHVSVPRQAESKPSSSLQEEEEQPEKKSAGWWDPIYSIPLGITAAVPVLHYEWYLINEETQLLACFMLFTALIYRNFGQSMFEYLEQDGKKTLEEHNKAEDEIINILQDKIDDISMQSRIVQDAKDIHALKLATYDKLNAAGKNKPLYDFKAQMERLLSLIAQEEAAIRERAKHSLMVEATASVTKEFATSAELKKQSLTNAIAVLQGSGAGVDPVKAAYVKFFKAKQAEAAKADVNQEIAAARATVVTKLNSVAKTENFYFQFDKEGKPTMVA